MEQREAERDFIFVRWQDGTQAVLQPVGHVVTGHLILHKALERVRVRGLQDRNSVDPAGHGRTAARASPSCASASSRRRKAMACSSTTPGAPSRLYRFSSAAALHPSAALSAR